MAVDRNRIERDALVTAGLEVAAGAMLKGATLRDLEIDDHSLNRIDPRAAERRRRADRYHQGARRPDRRAAALGRGAAGSRGECPGYRRAA